MQLNYQDSLENILQIQPTEIVETKVKIKLTLNQRKAARRAKQLIGKNKGRWGLEERREYYIFLKIYSQFFVTKDHRRNDKVFRMMANFIKTRTPDQCRTHHQKLQFKYFKLSKIIETLKEQFGQIDYDEILKKCESISTNIDTPTSLTQRDDAFNPCYFQLFTIENNQNKNEEEISLKQPSILDSPSCNQLIEVDPGFLINIVPSFNDFLD